MPNCTYFLRYIKVGDLMNPPLAISLATYDNNSYTIIKKNVIESVYQTVCLYECADGWLFKSDNPY